MLSRRCVKECLSIAFCCCYTSKEAKLIVVEGTLYPLLTRLKNDGLLSYEWKESTQGPPRKYYTLTDNGVSFLNELDLAWNELAFAVSVLRINDEPKLLE